MNGLNNGKLLALGDSGSLLINERGRAVGMLNGGLTAVSELGRSVELEEGSFIPPTQDILEWARDVLFEDVEFVCTN